MSAVSPAEYETRIRQLERLNATLAAEIDRMRPVVQMAKKWKWQQVDDDDLVRAITAYFDAYEVSRE